MTELYSEEDIINGLREAVKRASSAKWSDAECINFIAKNIECLSKKNRNQFFIFFEQEIISNTYGYRILALNLISRFRYSSAYDSIYNSFIEEFNKQDKDSFVKKDAPALDSRAYLYNAAHISFKIRYEDRIAVYKQYIYRTMQEIHNGSELYLLIDYINIDAGWSVKQLALYYYTEFENSNANKAFLIRSYTVYSFLRIVPKYGIEVFEGFLNELQLLSNSVFSEFKTVVEAFIKSGELKRWGLSVDSVCSISVSLKKGE